MPSRRIRKLVDRTRFGGGELVSLLGTSAWYAPGAAAAQMVDSICLDEKRVLPCTVYLQGEYGIDGLYMGVPAKLGAGGVEDIVTLRLTPEEKKMLRASAAPSGTSSASSSGSSVDLGLEGRTAIVCGASAASAWASPRRWPAKARRRHVRSRRVVEREAARLGGLAVAGT